MPYHNGVPFQGHSVTSWAAAVRFADAAPTARARVRALLEYLAPEGLTDEQITDALHMNPSTERPRRIELTAAGIVVDSRTTRATRSGAQAVVWVVR